MKKNLNGKKKVKKYGKKWIEEHYKSSVDHQIIQNRMGCLIQPYKPKQSYLIEQNTGKYDPIYFRYNQYVGFTIPYGGTLCYATYNREFALLKRAFPDYDIKKGDFNNYRKLGYRVHIVNVDHFKPVQTEMINIIDESKEKGERIWFLHLQTASGKTLLATYYMTKFNLKTCILCFSNGILKQWEETLATKTDIDMDRVVRLDGRLMDRILNGKIGPEKFDVYIATPTLFDRYCSDRDDYKKLTDFFNYLGIGYLIYDEAHRNVGSIVRFVSVVNPKYQIYLSADFSQGEDSKEFQFKNVFKNISILEPTAQLQQMMKYTRILVVGYNTNPTAVEKDSIFDSWGYSPELYMRYEFNKQIIIDALLYNLSVFMGDKMNKNKTYRALILFNNIEHVEIIYRMLVASKTDYKIGKYYSALTEEYKMDVKNNSDIIVATYGSFSTGLDTNNIKYIFSCNQCNKVQDNQAAGRSRPLPDGSDAIYIMLVDTGFPYCKSKLQKRLNYLMETKSKDEVAAHYIYNPALHIGEDLMFKKIFVSAEEVGDLDPDNIKNLEEIDNLEYYENEYDVDNDVPPEGYEGG